MMFMFLRAEREIGGWCLGFYWGWDWNCAKSASYPDFIRFGRMERFGVHVYDSIFLLELGSIRAAPDF